MKKSSLPVINIEFLTNSDLFKLKGPGYYEPYLDNNQHFFFDNFFTSVDLMQHMQLRNTCACGTIHQNRKDLPADLERIDLVAGEVRTCQSGNLEVVEMPVLVLCHFVHGEHLVLSWKNYLQKEATPVANSPSLSPDTMFFFFLYFKLY